MGLPPATSYAPADSTALTPVMKKIFWVHRIAYL
jgi:hypothetical protein